MSSCQSTPTIDIEACKVEVVNAEKAFETMVAEEGMAKAFIHFAADTFSSPDRD